MPPTTDISAVRVIAAPFSITLTTGDRNKRYRMLGGDSIVLERKNDDGVWQRKEYEGLPDPKTITGFFVNAQPGHEADAEELAKTLTVKLGLPCAISAPHTNQFKTITCGSVRGDSKEGLLAKLDAWALALAKV